MKISENEDYLLTEISDVVITFARAKIILDYIGKECLKLNYNKVLLDARSVEKRDMTPYQIKGLGHHITHTNLNKIRTAFLCREHLIDTNANRLRLFVYTNKCVIQYFSKESEAIEWLNGNNDEILLYSKKRQGNQADLHSPDSEEKDISNNEQQHIKPMVFIKHKDYLVAKISDVVMTLKRAKEMWDELSKECTRTNCYKVLFDEMTLERRTVLPHHIMEISKYIVNKETTETHIAFWCKEHLINKDSERLGLFTYKEKPRVKYFAKESEAIEWLNNIEE